jgi:hypothetical protein
MRERLFKPLLALSLVTGCATMSDVVKARNEGERRLYPVTCDQAYDIAGKIFRSEGSDAIEDHRAEGYILTSSGANRLTWGTFMGAWTEPATPGHCLVTVLTKRRMALNAATTLTETTSHNRFAQAVAEIASSASSTKPIALVPGNAEQAGCERHGTAREIVSARIAFAVILGGRGSSAIRR